MADGLVVAAAGPGGGPHVKGFTPDRTEVFSFFAFAPGVADGVKIRTIDGEVVVAAQPDSSEASRNGTHVLLCRSHLDPPGPRVHPRRDHPRCLPWRASEPVPGGTLARGVGSRECDLRGSLPRKPISENPGFPVKIRSFL